MVCRTAIIFYIKFIYFVSEIPDILNPKQLELLRNWGGELRYLQNFKTVKFTKEKLLEKIKKQEIKAAEIKPMEQ